MEPQAEQETSRSRIDVDVQTVGLNAETKKCRHRAGGEDFVLTFPLIGRFHDGGCVVNQFRYKRGGTNFKSLKRISRHLARQNTKGADGHRSWNV